MKHAPAGAIHQAAVRFLSVPCRLEKLQTCCMSRCFDHGSFHFDISDRGYEHLGVLLELSGPCVPPKEEAVESAKKNTALKMANAGPVRMALRFAKASEREVQEWVAQIGSLRQQSCR